MIRTMTMSLKGTRWDGAGAEAASLTSASRSLVSIRSGKQTMLDRAHQHVNQPIVAILESVTVNVSTVKRARTRANTCHAGYPRC